MSSQVDNMVPGYLAFPSDYCQSICEFFVIRSTSDIVFSGLDVFWYRMTNPHPDTVHVACRTPIGQVFVCLVCLIHCQDSPLTIWNMPIVHTGEVRPYMYITVCFGGRFRVFTLIFWLFNLLFQFCRRFTVRSVHNIVSCFFFLIRGLYIFFSSTILQTVVSDVIGVELLWFLPLF